MRITSNFIIIFHFNFDEPLKTIHYNAEGVINYKALLYLPTNQPMDLFNSDKKNKIKLYVQKVFHY